MGDQSTLKLHYTLIMKAFIFATLLALATASPIEDTPEVAAAKAEFQKAFDAAVAGEHAGLMVTDGRTIITDGRVQGPTAYLADDAAVAEAKAAFKAAFDAAAAGEHAALAPKPVEALPVAPVAPVSPRCLSLCRLPCCLPICPCSLPICPCSLPICPCSLPIPPWFPRLSH